MKKWRLRDEVPLPKVTQLVSARVWLQAMLCPAVPCGLSDDSQSHLLQREQVISPVP